jgi:hypothetical protein
MKNLHLTHIEDVMFESPFLPLEVMQDTYNYFLGEAGVNPATISIKWDGSPAFVCGIHPTNKRFFLGTKSVFSGKVNYSDEDIDRNHPESFGLRYKLHELFHCLSFLEWSGIYQGDLLWIGFEGYCIDHRMSFRPNTLYYRMDVKNTKPYLGAVLHTTYTGESMETLEAHSGALIPLHSDDLFLFEPTLQHPPFEGFDFPKYHEFQDQFETAYITTSQFAQEVGLSCQYILEELRRPYVSDILNRYINHCVSIDVGPSSSEFLFFLEDKIDAHIKSLKSEKGKAKLTLEKGKILYNVGTPDLIKVFLYYNMLVRLKIILIDRMNLEAQDGIIIICLPNGTQCGHEGFCISDKGRLYKFVDRRIFSRANFNTKKEWEGK